jgi:hypothetical protein
LGILSALLGHTKLKTPDRDVFLSIVGAAFDLRGRTDLRILDKAGIVMSPAESDYFDNLDAELRQLLDLSGRATGTRFEVTDDDFGTRWVVLDDPDFEDLVSTIHLISETVADHGFADRILAAAFSLEYQRRNVYWIYNYKSGKFYPFVASAERQRDNATEMRLGEVMKEQELPVERRLERWYEKSPTRMLIVGGRWRPPDKSGSGSGVGRAGQTTLGWGRPTRSPRLVEAI